MSQPAASEQNQGPPAIPMLTDCRCGEKINGGICPKQYKHRELAIYHDIAAQQFDVYLRNTPTFKSGYGNYWWTVVAEGDQFRAYSGDEPSPQLFKTERKAWLELEKVYCGKKVWPEPEDDPGPEAEV